MNALAKLVERWKSRRSAIDNALRGAQPGPTSPDQIAVIEPPSIGPGRLHPNLLPEQVWGSNLRAVLPRGDWNRFRISVCERDGNRCEVCGTPGFNPVSGRPRRPDCHELWSFVIHGDRFVQCLAGLCADCHRCQHIGLAEIRGQFDLVRRQLGEVNGWSPAQAQAALAQAFDTHRCRLGFAWDLVLALLHDRITVAGFPNLFIAAADRTRLGSSFREH